MDIVALVVLLVVLFVTGWIDLYSVQRTYADRYAERYGRIPPLVDWFFVADADGEVEHWRRLHRNLTILGFAIVGVLVVIALAHGIPFR